MESSKTASIKQLLTFSLTGEDTASKEICAHVRALIKNGTLPPGTAIPPTKALAAAWDVFPNTVKIALDPLVKEGLLDRRRYRGSYVLDGRGNVRRLGIYENFGSISAGDRDFLLSLQIELALLLEKQNAELKVWIDGRKSPKALPENLVEACRTREIDGVVTSHPDRGILKSLAALHVPVSALSSFRDCPNRVDFRFKDLVINAVRRLAELGVRKVAVISNVVPEAATETTNPQDVSRFYSDFLQAIGDHGMETRPEWMIQPPAGKAKLNIERFGYDAIKALWSQNPHPEGLFIFPHTAARGSLTALLERGVNIPGELKLVAHGNIENPILTPYPVDWITSSSREIAHAMVTQIQSALDGLPTKPIWLKHHRTW